MRPLVLLLATPAVAQTPLERGLPLYEIGVGAFALANPEYPASGRTAVNGLPFPYLVYRGDVLQVDEDGAALVPIDNDVFRIGVSADGAFPASSDDNPLREGLPDLETLGGIGPEIVLKGPRLDFGDRGRATLDVALEARAVFSLDLDSFAVGYEGAVLEPELRYRQTGLFGPGSSLTAAISPAFATEDLQDYFYEVPGVAARPGRPAFDAEAGYIGTEIDLGIGLRLTERWQVFGGVGLDLHQGAANSASPLFEEEVTASAFLGFTFAIFQSARRVGGR